MSCLSCRLRIAVISQVVFSVRAALRVCGFLQAASVHSSYVRDLIYNDLSQSRYSNECNGNKRNRKVCFTADLPKRKENNMAKLNCMSSVSDCRYTWTFFSFPQLICVRICLWK